MRLKGLDWIRFFSLVALMIHSTAIAAPMDKDYQLVQSNKELRIEKLRNEEIKAVKMALGLRNPENRKSELYLRLAELYLEAYRADFLLEGRIHEKALKSNPSAPFVRMRSREDLRNGIGAAETILKLDVKSPKLDQIYFFLGYNYGEYGDKKSSSLYFKKLANEFPDSPFSIEGIRALADDAFQGGDFSEAERQYEIAIKKTDDPAQKARIYHKLAWCYYRQRRSQDAVTTMKRAIEIARSSGGGEKLLSIREEGLRDLAVYYAELGRVDEAIDYFRENAGGDGKLVRVLEKLGKEYERTGQVEKAKQVYEVLLKTDQRDESSFRVAVKMVDLDLLKENFESAAARLKNIEVPRSSDPDTQIAVVNLRRQVRSTAVGNHDRYNRKDDKREGRKFLDAADLFYTIYLNKFIASDKAGKIELNEVRMYLADVKREKGEPGAAAELYKKVIQDKDEKYAKQAAQLWVGSLDSELKKRRKAGEKPGADPSELERDFIEASDLLERSIPDSFESREARYKAAYLLSEYSAEKPVAIKRASALAKDFPNHPQGVYAARLWLKLEPTKGTYADLSREPTLLDTDLRMKGELKKDLEIIARNLRVSEISGFEKGKEFDKAGKAYEEFARNATSEKEAESAYIGAIGSYAQQGDSEQVVRVMKEWRVRYPKSVTLVPSVKREATKLLVRGFFSDSAELFLGIGKLLYDRASLMGSAELFAGALQYKKAVGVYRQILGLAQNDEERAGLFRKIALVSIDEGDEEGVLQSWKECAAMNSSFKAECLCQIANFYLAQQDQKPAREKFESVVGIRSGPSSRSPYIAYAQFRLAQLAEKEMKREPLEFPAEKLKRSYDARIAELSSVFGAYQKAAGLDGPWGIAATERMGDIALELSTDVENALSDSRATPELKSGMMELVTGFNQKAVELAKGAYQKAQKEQLLSPALPILQDRLVDAGVGGMRHSQGVRAGIKLIGMDPDGGKIGREEALKKVREALLKNLDDALAWIDYGNLLWGLGKPGLSSIAYDRSFSLKARYADAQNNRAVVMISDLGLENWIAANEAVTLWRKAIQVEPGNAAALFNLGHIFNYYRLFNLALPHLQNASRRVKVGEVHDALAVAYWGLGKKTETSLNSKKAESLGLRSDRFTRKFRESSQLKGEECLSRLGEIAGGAELKGFERISVNRMKQRCQL
ncbi:MAG: tetratricopeptide repeat protein [Bdellovibrionales bacterium]|nr:tetratricopeptide repeat protein [Bdellovibrionales bacterium]